MKHFEALYGLRPRVDEIFFLNAWEVLMWWRGLPLQRFLRAGQPHALDAPRGPRRFMLRYPPESGDLAESLSS